MVQIRLKKTSCVHRLAGRRSAAIEAFFITSDKRHRSVGSVCSQCIDAWGVDGLRTWAGWHIGQAISWQPWLGEVRIMFEGAEKALSREARSLLLRYLDEDKQTRVEMRKELNEREGMDSLTAAELSRRIAFEA